MRNGTLAAGGFVRSAIYRDIREDVEPRPALETSGQPGERGSTRAATPKRSGRSRGPSRVTALALLGLLDILAG
jgi:hypothetical protein